MYRHSQVHSSYLASALTSTLFRMYLTELYQRYGMRAQPLVSTADSVYILQPDTIRQQRNATLSSTFSTESEVTRTHGSLRAVQRRSLTTSSHRARQSQ